MNRIIPLLLIFVPLAPRESGAVIGELLKQVFGGASSSASKPAEPKPLPKGPMLFWRTYESLPGRLTAVDEQTVTWTCPFFDKPAVIDRSALWVLEVPLPEKLKLEDSLWQVRLRGGDVLMADALAGSGEDLLVSTARFGELRVPVKELLSVRRLKGEGIVHAGPSGLKGWKAGAWFLSPYGALSTRQWNKTAELPMPLPEKVRIELHLSSTLRPKVDLNFWTVGGTTVPRIETWDDEVVLVSSSSKEVRFAPLMTLKPEDHDFRLTVCWDKAARKVQAYSWTGELLGEIPQAEEANAAKKPTSTVSTQEGVFVRNRGLNLVIEHLSVLPWDGTPLPQRNVGQPVVTTVAQGELGGSVEAGETGLKVAGQDVKWADVVAWRQDVIDIPPGMEPTQSILLWLDGNVIVGPLVKADAETATLKPVWAQQPVIAKTSDLWRWHLGVPNDAPPHPDLAKLDRLKVGTHALHGMLEGAAGKTEPQWRLVGGRDALGILRPKDGQPVEMVRAEMKTDEVGGALMFLTGGEVLRGNLKGVDENEVLVESKQSGRRALMHDQLHAVHWTGSKILENKGFRDPGWRQARGGSSGIKLEKGDAPEKDKVTIQPESAYGHPSIVSGDEIRFTVSAKDGWGGMKLNLFSPDLAKPDAGSFAVVFYFSGNDLYVLVGGDENMGVSDRQTLRNLKQSSANIRITFIDDRLEVYANETRMGETKVELKNRQGAGLVFNSGSLWGNTPRECVISGFQVVAKPGQLPMLKVPPAAKNEALTVPRFRRDVMPTHALIAPNGDLVRGRLEAATGQRVKFTSGLETIEVPMDRVQAMVWLQKPVDAKKDKPLPQAPSSVAASTHWLVLRDGSWLGLNVREFGAQEVLGDSVALGSCRVPLQDISVIWWARPEATSAIKSHIDWTLVPAAEPVLPEPGSSSPLVGKPAPDIKLPLLGGGEFELAKARGQVVVLDFWATWCGPCAVGIPETIAVTAGFDARKVRLVTVNKGEQEPLVKKFLQARNWKMDVAMDSKEDVSKRYGLEGIPFTVVIDAKGKVSWTSTGVSATSAEKLREAVKKALGE